MAYLTWREYVRSGPVCLGALILIAGAVIALLASQGIYDIYPPYGVTIGAALAVVGLIFIILGFVFTAKKRDSVLAPIDTRQDDTPPPPPPPD